MSDPIAQAEADSSSSSEAAEFEALGNVMRAVQPLSPDSRLRVIAAITALLGKPGAGVIVHSRGSTAPSEQSSWSSEPRFSTDRTPSPKEFLFEKRPNTDVERITCLAYYLTHYRDTPTFKTLELSKLNTEAAQLKLSNATYASDNATRSGFLVQASKGAKQISAIGELYVQALPDRQAAREAISHAKPKRKRGKHSRPNSQSTSQD